MAKMHLTEYKSEIPNSKSPMFLILSFHYHLGRTTENLLLPLIEPVVDNLADGDGVIGVPTEGTVTA